MGKGPPFLLDVRNGYEWDTGRFEVRAAAALRAFARGTPADASAPPGAQGAERPVTESFRETVEAYSAPGGCVITFCAALRFSYTSVTDARVARPLANAPRDAEIMMYCTGGAAARDACILR